MGTNKTTPSFPLLIMNIKLLSAATAAVLVSGSATLITTAAAEARPQTLASPQAMASMLASSPVRGMLEWTPFQAGNSIRTNVNTPIFQPPFSPNNTSIHTNVNTPINNTIQTPI